MRQNIPYGCLGGSSGNAGGSITIWGGTVTAISNSDGPAIGGATGTNNITIHSGTVIATGGGGGTGIGTNGGTCNVAIYGGNVTATGGSLGAGIGASGFSNGGSILIEGGVVQATNTLGVGIGGAGSPINITIKGGVVTATSDDNYAFATTGNITISSGTVNATGKTDLNTGAISPTATNFIMDGDALVYANVLSADVDKDQLTGGMLFVGTPGSEQGNLYGSVTLPDGGFTLRPGQVLEIPIGASLRVSRESPFENKGSIANRGRIQSEGLVTNDGKIQNEGEIVNRVGGSLFNAGSFINTTDGVLENEGLIENTGTRFSIDTDAKLINYPYSLFTGDVPTFTNAENVEQGVVWEANGGTFAAPAAQPLARAVLVVPATPTGTVSHGTEISPPAVSREGYVFDGWYTDPAFTPASVPYFPLQVVRPMVFYAKWVPVAAPSQNGPPAPPAEPSPQTADTNASGFWVLLLVASGFGLAALLLRSKSIRRA